MEEIESQHLWCVVQKTFALLLIIVIFTAIMPLTSLAVNVDIINTDCASDGYFTVCYPADTLAKMKVGIMFNNKQIYYNYVPTTESSYAFLYGNGSYTIYVYQHVQNNTYKIIAFKTVDVKLDNSLAPYLVCDNAISFAADDAVYKKTKEICRGLTSDAAKVMTIHRYIAEHISYDYTLANKVRAGLITSYVPDVIKTLTTRKGICYDTAALYATMCRIESIPCVIEKGYCQNAYHAWNKVYVNNTWHTIDVALPVTFF